LGGKAVSQYPFNLKLVIAHAMVQRYAARGVFCWHMWRVDNWCHCCVHCCFCCSKSCGCPVCTHRVDKTAPATSYQGFDYLYSLEQAFLRIHLQLKQLLRGIPYDGHTRIIRYDGTANRRGGGGLPQNVPAGTASRGGHDGKFLS